MNSTKRKPTKPAPAPPAKSELPILFRRLNSLTTGDAKRLWLKHKDAITLLSKSQPLLMEARAREFAAKLDLAKWSEQALWAISPAEYHKERDCRSNDAKSTSIGMANARAKAQEVWNEFATLCIRQWVAMAKAGTTEEMSTSASGRG